jgi:hypothetical protein
MPAGNVLLHNSQHCSWLYEAYADMSAAPHAMSAGTTAGCLVSCSPHDGAPCRQQCLVGQLRRAQLSSSVTNSIGGCQQRITGGARPDSSSSKGSAYYHRCTVQCM